MTISRFLRRTARAFATPRVVLYKSGDSIAVHPEAGVRVVLIDAAEPFVTRTCDFHRTPEQIDAILANAWGGKVIEGSVA